MGMSRHLRFVPDGGALIEVTCRTIQGRLLLRPSQQLNGLEAEVCLAEPPPRSPAS